MRTKAIRLLPLKKRMRLARWSSHAARRARKTARIRRERPKRGHFPIDKLYLPDGVVLHIREWTVLDGGYYVVQA